MRFTLALSGLLATTSFVTISSAADVVANADKAAYKTMATHKAPVKSYDAREPVQVQHVEKYSEFYEPRSEYHDSHYEPHREYHTHEHEKPYTKMAGGEGEMDWYLGSQDESMHGFLDGNWLHDGKWDMKKDDKGYKKDDNGYYEEKYDNKKLYYGGKDVKKGDYGYYDDEYDNKKSYYNDKWDKKDGYGHYDEKYDGKNAYYGNKGMERKGYGYYDNKNDNRKSYYGDNWSKEDGYDRYDGKYDSKDYASKNIKKHDYGYEGKEYDGKYKKEAYHGSYESGYSEAKKDIYKPHLRKGYE
ncbi:hypothetical protein NSK_007512 [Nannochloropsis salina CCMP1776]|jgi:hypothetical protein|uniref:Uncharacterized protein n=1 Tax=Nannochloropsis salina CCMP1776 TaxID=1027361 RepID=A0A4D9CPW8_9STRA|nr:hypothetical protein NSK_007512 [Nannochloropsis salina CCMP1776]|eukprot:TFJ81170.1 hypothetical protein NSK_007512 [Nannochloropsis salina CCMP1776]